MKVRAERLHEAIFHALHFTAPQPWWGWPTFADGRVWA